MKYALLLGVLLAGMPGWRLLTMVHDRNAAVADATAAYRRGEAGRAALAFKNALAAGGTRQPDPRLILNLAHAQARAGQPDAARATYGRLLTGSTPQLGSIARQQLAVLTAQRGELAQAASLLRQALLLDPANAGARYDYEVVSEYLARRPNRPQLGPSPPPPAAAKPKPNPDKNPSDNQQKGQKTGTDHQGQANQDQPSPTAPPARRDNPTGAPDPQRPNGGSGAAAPGSRQPGAGPEQPLANGDTPGQQGGLDRSSATPGTGQPSRSPRAGTEAATPADVQLQTQRERLEAMSLSPAQARQLLETLRAQEQQYLQQLARPAAQKPDPNRPTW